VRLARLLFWNLRRYGAAADDSLHHRSNVLTITTAHIPAIVALIAGLLILIMPRLLNFIVAIYLIVIGLVGLGLLRWLHM
jgi:Protein of unknown function (DUF3096)